MPTPKHERLKPLKYNISTVPIPKLSGPNDDGDSKILQHMSYDMIYIYIYI